MYPLLEIYLIDTWMTVESAAIESLNQSEAHLKPGTLLLEWDLVDVPDLGKDDDVAVRVKQDAEDAGTVIFSGKITARQSNGTTATYTASNVLNDLQRLLMVVNGGTKFNLFRDDTGSAITIGHQISAALDYAAAQGIAVAYNQAEMDALDLDMPATEVSDITVYEIIKKALIYRSDIMVAVEYAAPGSDSKVRLVDQADLAPETLVIGKNIASYSAKALYDRQIKGVILTYKWTDTDAEGVESPGYSTETYGSISGVNILRQEVEILGTKFQQSASIPLHRFTQYTNKTGWNWKNDGYSETESVWNFWAGVAMAAYQWANPGAYTYDMYIHGSGNEDDEIANIVWPELYSASPANWVIFPQDLASSQWIRNALAAYNVRPFIGSCQMMYDDLNNRYLPINVTEDRGLLIIDAPSSPIVLSSFSVPDKVPSGLAEQLYNILSPLQYDGQVVCYDKLTTPSSICSILRKLNIAGGADDLETMSAIVQKCGIDLLNLIRTDTFGVASHLEPQDFIALCRANKTIGNLRLA